MNLRLDRISASPLNPRKTFDEGKLAELAQSIRTHGVLEPILVRPTYFLHQQKSKKSIITPEDYHLEPHHYPEMTFELVAGERRWRAAKLAGLATIPAKVHRLDDKAALEIMVIENEQRDDVAPLEKAEGYHILIDMHGYTVDALAEKVGKSASTIRGLLKLRQLPEEARVAVESGILPASIAQLIARVPGEKARAEATQGVLEGEDQDGATMSFREAKEYLEENFMVELKGAPFDRLSLGLVPSAGACTVCPKLTGNNPEEFAGSRPDVCTDPECFRAKVVAHRDKTIESAQTQGRRVLTPKQCKELFPHLYGGMRSEFEGERWVDMDETCWENHLKPHARGKTWSALLDISISGELVYATDQAGTLHTILPRKRALAALKELDLLQAPGKKEKALSAEDQRWARAEKARAEKAKREKLAAEEATEEIVCRMIALGKGLVEGDPEAPELRALVMAAFGDIWHDCKAVVLKRRGITVAKVPGRFDAADKAIADHVDKLSGPELFGLLAELTLTRSLHYGDDRRRTEICKAFGMEWGKLAKRQGDKVKR